MANLTIRPINTGYAETYKKQYQYHHSTHKYHNVDDGKLLLPCMAFLIEGGDKLVLVDTGMSNTEIANKYHHPGSYQPDGFAIHEQLAKLGIKCEDIDIVIFTHMHWDHMHNMDKFVNARFIAHKKEWEFCQNPIPLYYKSYEHPKLGIKAPFTGLKIETVEGEQEIVPGIRVFESFGHSPGHMSVEVDCEDGSYILCGDAIFIYDNLKPVPDMFYDITPPARFANMIECWNSIVEMKKRAKEQRFILPTHEPEIEELAKKYGTFPIPKK